MIHGESLQLYAIAYEDRGNPKIDYLHAKDQANARYLFFASVRRSRGIKVVAIAPAIGYHVEDEHGEKLTA